MLDKYIVPRLKPVLRAIAVPLHARGVSADTVTITGFFLGIATIPAHALGFPLLAMALLLLNRFFDGLDGELARLGTPTDAGGFLDITLDFIFYAVFPLGFAFVDPAQNALPAALLIASFVGTGASFLAFAGQAEKRAIVSPDFGYKGLYYLNGLAEGTETIIFFTLMCAFPKYFQVLAGIFTFICLITAANRIIFGYRTLR
jgi:phosphatidylglycerophosphate synthase